jgi:hypothetical protein
MKIFWTLEISWGETYPKFSLRHAGILDQNSNMAELRKGTTAKRRRI